MANLKQCDRCKGTAVSDDGARGFERPEGWITVQYCEGPALGNVSRDLCTGCKEGYHAFLAGRPVPALPKG